MKARTVECLLSVVQGKISLNQTYSGFRIIKQRWKDQSSSAIFPKTLQLPTEQRRHFIMLSVLGTYPTFRHRKPHDSNRNASLLIDVPPSMVRNSKVREEDPLPQGQCKSVLVLHNRGVLVLYYPHMNGLGRNGDREIVTQCVKIMLEMLVFGRSQPLTMSTTKEIFGAVQVGSSSTTMMTKANI